MFCCLICGFFFFKEGLILNLLFLFLFLFLFFCSLRNFMCLVEMEKDEKQAGFLEKEGGKYLVELDYCGTTF